MGSQDHGYDLPIVLTEDLYAASFRAFLDMLEPNRVIEILKPVFVHWGTLVGHQAYICGIKPSKLDEYISYLCFSVPLIWGGEARGEMFENGSKTYVYGCRCEGSSREICHLRCEVMSEAGIKAFNPDYGMHRTKSLSTGDSECEFLWKKEGESSLGKPINFDQLIPEKREVEAILNWMPSANAEVWKAMTEAFVRSVSEEEAIPFLQQYMRSLGESKGKEYANALEIEGSHIDSLGRLTEEIFGILQAGGPCLAKNTDGCDKSVLACPFSKSPIMCLQMEALCNGICEALNPEYEFSYDQMMSKGDPKCHWAIRRKIIDISGSGESALEILKKRFAKGEISKEEYLEMKALLEG